MRSLPATLVLAAGSGLAALIYEIVWFQLLELVIGSSTVSLGILLATFMGGTCLGSLLFPRLVASRGHALRVYAAVEIGIALLGVAVLFFMPMAGRYYSAWSSSGLNGFLLRGIVAAACLLPPTLLMGATLPALARTAPPGRDRSSWLGFIYGGNLAGAVAGCLIAGFYLLRHFDVATATYVAAGINVAIAIVALALAATPWFLNASSSSISSANSLESESAASHKWTIYAAVALSGLCALASEAVWTRTLGLLFGASVYTFSILLAVYLFGLGIGSSVASLVCRRLERPGTALALCQALAGAAIAWSAFHVGAAFPYWPMDPSLSSSIWINFQIDLFRAMWAVLPATILWGATFPLAMAALRSTWQDSARLMAGVYAVNTLGAIVGALAASVFVVGWLGSQRLQQALVVLSMLSAVLVVLPDLWSGSQRLHWNSVWVALSAVLLAPPLAALVPPLPAELIAHGRYAATWVGKGDIVYTKEGLNSSVAVSRFPNGTVTFHVAGKIQASSAPRDMRLQRMLGHLTTLATATPRSVLVIGCGAGVTAGAVAIDPAVERVTLVEIEPVVPEAASEYFSDYNFGVLRSPKVHLRIDDGRHYLQTTEERFDAITADPLDPWVKGAANLYTKEFFEIARQRLNPGGVVTMYIQLFETNDAAVRSAVATFFEVFPEATVWGNTHEGKGYDMVLLGQVEPLRVDLDGVDRRLSLPGYQAVSNSMHEIGMPSAMDLFATYAGRASDLKAWLRGVPLNRDSNLRMQYLAGTGLNLDDSAAIFAGMLRHRRFPEDVFVAEESRRNALREAILASNR